MRDVAFLHFALTPKSFSTLVILLVFYHDCSTLHKKVKFLLSLSIQSNFNESNFLVIFNHRFNPALNKISKLFHTESELNNIVVAFY